MAADDRNLKKRLLQFVSKREQFNQTELKNYFKGDTKKLLPLLQSLVHSQRLQTCKNHDGTIFWKVNSSEHSRKYQGLKAEHMLVLQEIKKSGSKGVWVRNIRAKTKLPTVAINKILQLLEHRQLVKSIKSITAKKQKLYMSFDVTPDKEHTGGVWYNSEGEFDEEYVSFICKWTLAMIKQHQKLSVKELLQLLKKSNISKVVLVEQDIQRIIDKLRFENEVEQFFDPEVHLTGNGGKKWKIVNKVPIEQHLTNTPCGVCPVSDRCCVGGVISPSTCLYMDNWLGSTKLTF